MVKKKVVLPESNTDCLMYKQLDSELLSYLCEIEHRNEGMLEVFWDLNTTNTKDGKE